MTDEPRRSPRSLRVVTVMPPRSGGDDLDATLDRWVTSTRLLEALAATSEVDAIGVGLAARSGEVLRHGVRHVFATSDRELAAVVRRLSPDVVHVHGTGFVSLLVRLRWALRRRGVPIVVQHHGEPVGPWRNRLAHRVLVSGGVAWMLTGADHGQAAPFRAAGLIARSTPVFDVLEAASTLPDDDGREPVVLEGAPSLLWVGRAIADKAPVVAVEALAASATDAAHLHLLVTDPTLTAEVVERAAALGVAARVHLHAAVERGEMHRWYRGADALLSTSRREGSNYSLIEAMTHGCHPVVSDLPSHRAILGALASNVAPPFPIDDAAAAGRRIAELAVAGDRPRDPIREHAATSLSWPAVARQLIDAYDTVLSSGRWS